MACFVKAVNLVIIHILLSGRIKFGKSFNVTRDVADRFVNPDCDSFTCPRSACDEFNAICVRSEAYCRKCICTAGPYTRNFVGYGTGKGRCLKDKEVDSGCYSFNDKSFIRNVYWENPDCKSNCFKTYKLMAPNKAENIICSLIWQNSSVLINSKPWKPVAVDTKDFKISNVSEDSGGIHLKVNSRALYNWSGTVLKLQVKCHSKTMKLSYEQHCVMLKFFGEYSVTHKRQPLSKPKTTASAGHGCKSNPYKYSTIALAVITFILILIIGILLIRKMRGKRFWDAHDIQGQPFNDTEERAEL